MELGGDLRLVDVGFLVDWVMGDCGGVYGLVYVLEIKYMVIFLYDGFVG